MRRPPAQLLSLLLIILVFGSSIGSLPDPCADPASLLDPLTLRLDKLTVLISGFSEARLPLLRSLAARYASLHFVDAVFVLWSNPSSFSAAAASANLPPSVTLLRLPSPSLNARFLPLPVIRTRAVAVCDDDVEIDASSLALALAAWSSRAGRPLVGFFARSHALDLAAGAWIYTAPNAGRYSMVLTKFAVLATGYLHRYTCGGGAAMAAARRVVDALRNCEDILMNFVAAAEGGEGPVLVEGRRIMDWGDPRGTGTVINGSVKWPLVEEIRRVGLSSKADHLRTRGRCITEFHRLLGVMPLRYSQGRVAAEVHQQVWCLKGDKLSYCDQQA